MTAVVMNHRFAARRRLRSWATVHSPAAAPDLDGLLVLAADGDRGAFETLYRSLASSVYGIVLATLRDPAMSEEVAQDVFVEVWRTAARFDPERGSAKAWVVTMARRRAVDRVRSEQSARDRVAEVGVKSVEPSTDVTFEAVERSEDRGEVTAALGVLSDLQRDVIERAFFGDRTYREVAEDLGLPLGTVKTRMRDALLRLGREMGAER